MKKVLFITLIVLSATSYAQEEKKSEEAGQKKTLMDKQIKIIKTIKSQLNKLSN